jgi:prophage regulatory protein
VGVDVQDPGRFLTIEQVAERISLGRSEIYDRVKGGRFPEPLKLAAKKTVWVEAEVIEWQLAEIRRARS